MLSFFLYFSQSIPHPVSALYNLLDPYIHRHCAVFRQPCSFYVTLYVPVTSSQLPPVIYFTRGHVVDNTAGAGTHSTIYTHSRLSCYSGTPSRTNADSTSCHSLKHMRTHMKSTIFFIVDIVKRRICHDQVPVVHANRVYSQLPSLLHAFKR